MERALLCMWLSPRYACKICKKGSIIGVELSKWFTQSVMFAHEYDRYCMFSLNVYCYNLEGIIHAVTMDWVEIYKLTPDEFFCGSIALMRMRCIRVAMKMILCTFINESCKYSCFLEQFVIRNDDCSWLEWLIFKKWGKIHIMLGAT